MFEIITSSKLRTPIIENVTKSKVTGTDMFNLVKQFLLQEIGEDTPNRIIPADVKSALAIMCATRMSGEHSSDDFIRLSDALRSNTVSFKTLLESVRRHCQSTSYHFQLENSSMDATTGSTQCATLFNQLLKLNGKGHGFPFHPS